MSFVLSLILLRITLGLRKARLYDENHREELGMLRTVVSRP